MEKYHYFQNSKKICQNCVNLKSFHICSASTAQRQGNPCAMTFEMSTMLRKLGFLPFTGKIIFNLKDVENYLMSKRTIEQYIATVRTCNRNSTYICPW